MRKLPVAMLTGLGAVLVFSAVPAVAEHTKIHFEDAPAAVQASIKKAVGAGTLGDVEKELQDGKTIYEAEFTLDKADHSVRVSDAGAILEEETELDPKALPEAIASAVKAKYPTGKIEDASLVKAGDKTCYELAVEVGDDDHELQIDATGKILDDKVESEEKDEKGEKEHEKDGK